LFYKNREAYLQGIKRLSSWGDQTILKNAGVISFLEFIMINFIKNKNTASRAGGILGNAPWGAVREKKHLK
jgi:hypothetical protein